MYHVCTSTYLYVLVRTPTFRSVRDEKRCKQDSNPQSSAHLWQSLPLSYGTGPRRRDIIQVIIKVYMQCLCNTPCLRLFTWCLMTNRRRRSSCATAAGHDVPRPSPDLDLPEAQMRSIARLRACNVPPDRSSVQKKAVTRQLPCFSTLDTDEASHSESGSASARIKLKYFILYVAARGCVQVSSCHGRRRRHL